jgi:hypothetical protein
MLSNELADLFIDGSARVHYEFYGADYTKTASDHFPVSARLQLKALSLDGNTATNITCNGVANELLRLQFLAESRHTPIHG